MLLPLLFDDVPPNTSEAFNVIDMTSKVVYGARMRQKRAKKGTTEYFQLYINYVPI